MRREVVLRSARLGVVGAEDAASAVEGVTVQVATPSMSPIACKSAARLLAESKESGWSRPRMRDHSPQLKLLCVSSGRDFNGTDRAIRVRDLEVVHARLGAVVMLLDRHATQFLPDACLSPEFFSSALRHNSIMLFGWLSVRDLTRRHVQSVLGSMGKLRGAGPTRTPGGRGMAVS